MGRILKGVILGVTALAFPALASAQQSAAASVRIVVAPVDRVGFEQARPAQPSLAARRAQRGIGGPSPAVSPEQNAPHADQAVVVSSDALRLRSTDAPERLCPQATVRPGSPTPVLSVTREVRTAPSRPAGEPVEVVTCTLVAP